MLNVKSNKWVRFCAAIDGFRYRHKRWPESVKVPEPFLYELEMVLSEKERSLLASKIRIMDDNSPYIAMDEAGNSYNYGEEGFPEKEPDIRAKDWLSDMSNYDE